MRILVVRRDNIGDLVCTTPLVTALRVRYPSAWLGALVNSYNAPVLAGNPDLDAVLAYTKLKHLAPGESVLHALWTRVETFRRLRRDGLDYVVLASGNFSPRQLRLARWLGARAVMGFSDGSIPALSLQRSTRLVDVEGKHEVERVFSLAAHFGISGEIPPLKVIPDPAELAQVQALLRPQPGPRVAVHISARRLAQRWPAERFAALVKRLHEQHGASTLLLWAPGPANAPRHPGDDEKATELVRRIGNRVPLVAYPTFRLQELIAALAASDAVICADGGAMHIAAALRKPVVALFGDSPTARWRPWGTPHRVLQPLSGDVNEIAVGEVTSALASLLATSPRGRRRSERA